MMMEGINVLSIVEKGIYDFMWVPQSLLTASICLAFFGIILYTLGVEGLIFVIVLSPFAIGLINDAGQTQVDSYLEYKVTIDETVPLNEFYGRYEIVDQEGLIFTIKERNEEKASSI